VPTGYQGRDSPALTGAIRKKIIKIIKTQHHGIKFKEWSLRLKLATVDDKTMLLGREFQTFMTRYVKKWLCRTKLA